MIYFYKIQLCVKKIAKRRKKRFSPIYFDIFFSKKIAKSSSKAPKKESFEAKIGCLTILQKVIYTGKSLSEAFILTSTNPQYDKRLRDFFTLLKYTYLFFQIT
jgi:hypothetical protein